MGVTDSVGLTRVPSGKAGRSATSSRLAGVGRSHTGRKGGRRPGDACARNIHNSTGQRVELRLKLMSLVGPTAVSLPLHQENRSVRVRLGDTTVAVNETGPEDLLPPLSKSWDYRCLPP